MLDWLKDWINELVEWFFDFAQWIPKKLFSEVMDGLASFLEWIPVPSFISQASGAFGGIPGQVMYFASLFELNFGITVVLAAYSLRFIIRRIPLIG